MTVEEDRDVDELAADPVVRGALRRLSTRRQHCPRCFHGLVNTNSRHGFCQPCEREHDERLRASKRRSYHRRKTLTSSDTPRPTTTTDSDEVTVGEPGWRLLTVQEAAELLGVHRATVHAMIGDGRLRSLLLGTRTRRIPADAIVDYLDRLERPTDADGDE